MVLTLKPLPEQPVTTLADDLLEVLPDGPPGLTPLEAWQAIGSVWAPSTIARCLGRLTTAGHAQAEGEAGRRRYWRAGNTPCPAPPTIADAAALDSAWTVSCADCDHQSGVMACDLVEEFGARLVSELPHLLWCRQCGGRMVAVA